jgi:hypothetical protein
LNTSNILISDCNEGDIIAADIYNESGVKLVSRETVVNIYIKERLYEHGIENLRVYDPPVYAIKNNKNNKNAKFINMIDYYKRSALCIKNLINELASGNELDYEMVLYISDLIYNTQAYRRNQRKRRANLLAQHKHRLLLYVACKVAQT